MQMYPEVPYGISRLFLVQEDKSFHSISEEQKATALQD